MLYLALLRGINVGGKNMIKMADLKACFEASGFARSAYIQSGNVLFGTRFWSLSVQGPLRRLLPQGTAQCDIRPEGVPLRPEVDELRAGKGVVYSSRLASRATQSRINKVASLPIYQSVTIRSWGTTTKLLQLMDEL
jgi:uncharacterized protein (DUF1697 family)